jgi:hypothetical protein
VRMGDGDSRGFEREACTGKAVLCPHCLLLSPATLFSPKGCLAQVVPRYGTNLSWCTTIIFALGLMLDPVDYIADVGDRPARVFPGKLQVSKHLFGPC